MYRKASSGLAKHIDFILLDILCLQVSYCLASFIWQGLLFPLENRIYRNMMFIFFFSQILVILFDDSFKNILKRGYFEEFKATFRHVILIILFAAFYLFTTQEGRLYSRGTMWMLAELYFLISYAVRCLRKKSLHQNGRRRERSLLALTTEDMVREVKENIEDSSYSGICLKGIVLMEPDGGGRIGQELEGIPVVADSGTVLEYVCQDWVDEILISLPRDIPFPEDLYANLVEMGVTVHLRLLRAMKLSGQKQSVEKMGNYTVLSASVNMISYRQMMYKRLLDVAGGIVGCLLTGLICLVVGPLICIHSPGPVFYSQERVGKNGKIFRLYKFRSMYLDADERKKELMERNQVSDGRMFKIKDDPRIIGGEKGIGGFIRKYSIDEFPQFWNVLKGDMSLVGTRPPTVEEWEKYELSHRVRLATKPGITGLWQVSGRSSITDFDQVVKLDRQYILDWSMELDIRILLKTVVMVFRGDGAW